MIKEQTRGKSYSKIIGNIIEDVSNGQSLAKSLSKYPHVFGDFSVNIISFGESSGILSENLEYLADELKKKQDEIRIDRSNYSIGSFPDTGRPDSMALYKKGLQR